MSAAIETLKQRRKAHLEQIEKTTTEIAAQQASLGQLTTQLDRSKTIVADLERGIIELGGEVEEA